MRHRKPGFKILITLFFLTLLIRVWAASLISTPRALDECYYFSVARNLVSENSFISNIKWTYIDGTDINLPAPSNRLWMPGASILMALSMKMFGSDYRGAQVLIIFLSALFPVIVFYVSSYVLSCSIRRYTVWALMVITPWYFLYWSSLDNFALYGASAFCGLTFFWHAGKLIINKPLKGLLWAGLAGLFSGSAHLCRADGGIVLFSGIFYIFGLFLVKIFKKKLDIQQVYFKKYMYSFILLILTTLVFYLFVMGPWFYRNFNVFGEIMSSSAQKTIFLEKYNQMFYYSDYPGPEKFFSNGIYGLIKLKIPDFKKIAAFMFAAVFFWILIPFFIGSIFYDTKKLFSGKSVFNLFYHFWKDPMAVHFIYFFLSFTVISLIFTKPAVHGTLWHTSAAWLPLIIIISVKGFSKLFFMLNRKNKISKSELKKSIILTSVVTVCSGLLLCILYTDRLLSNWTGEFNLHRKAAHEIAVHIDLIKNFSQKDLIISSAPGLSYYLTGYNCIQLPLDGIDSIKKIIVKTLPAYVIAPPDKIDEIIKMSPEKICFSKLIEYKGKSLRIIGYNNLMN